MKVDVIINSKTIIKNTDVYDAVEVIKKYILFPLTVKKDYHGVMTIRIKKVDIE